MSRREVFVFVGTMAGLGAGFWVQDKMIHDYAQKRENDITARVDAKFGEYLKKRGVDPAVSTAPEEAAPLVCENGTLWSRIWSGSSRAEEEGRM